MIPKTISPGLADDVFFRPVEGQAQKDFDPREHRDAHGRWTSGGVGGVEGVIAPLTDSLDQIRESHGVPTTTRFEVSVNGWSMQGESRDFQDAVSAVADAHVRGDTNVEVKVKTGHSTTRLPTAQEHQAVVAGATEVIQRQQAEGVAPSGAAAAKPPDPYERALGNIASDANAYAGWAASVDKFANELRDEPPPLTMTPGRDDPKAVEASKKYEAIGERARAVVEDSPRVKAAKKDAADADAAYRAAVKGGPEGARPWHERQVARERLANARADAVHEVLRRTRPLGEDTGTDLKISSGEDALGAGELSKTMAEESGGLPTAWVQSINTRGPYTIVPIHDYGMSFQEGTRIFNVASDQDVGYDARPLRIHEMVHAIQATSPMLEGTDRAFLAEHGKQSRRSIGGATVPVFTRAGDDVFEPKKEPGNAWFDRYTGTQYVGAPGTEVSSTGIEYLFGGLRPYSKPDFKADPWNGRYRNHLDYSLGLLLKGGPIETAKDFKDAGLPVPPWTDPNRKAA